MTFISVSDSDPGSWLGKNPDPGSGINIPDNFFESLETILRDGNIKKKIYADPDPGSGIFLTLDPG